MNDKVSVGIWSCGMGTDRYAFDESREFGGFAARVRFIGGLKDIRGVELIYPSEVSEENWRRVDDILSEHNLSVAALQVELTCGREWCGGSLSAISPVRRAKAVGLVKRAMDFAQSIGVNTVNLWLGQDGFDYAFQKDYVKAYQFLIESIKECAAYNSKVNLGLEYKSFEPKMNCIIKNAGMALAVAQATGFDNVGITLDVGHSLNAGENPAEVAAILCSQKRLFHVHLNDTYRVSDNKLPPGSVHWIQFYELFYWLEHFGYDGWYSLDISPYRDDSGTACEASLRFIKGALDFVDQRLPKDFVTGTEEKPGEIVNTLFQLFFGGGCNI